MGRQIRDTLKRCTEQASFCLKVSHLESMGFPLAIAAAAFLVDRAGGIIKSCRTSWMTPRGNGVDILLEYEE